MNSQKGILPHIITPAHIVKQMKASQADIPSELSLPIALCATYQNLIVNIIDFDVFIRDHFLVCDPSTFNRPRKLQCISRSPTTHQNKERRNQVYLYPT
jgi:hypothetical protein